MKMFTEAVFYAEHEFCDPHLKSFKSATTYGLCFVPILSNLAFDTKKSVEGAGFIIDVDEEVEEGHKLESRSCNAASILRFFCIDLATRLLSSS